jgi:ATP/maltotriose-dependent transcriptional regulator MalT
MTSAEEFERSARPAMAGPAFARLGELRMRQGLLDDAQRLFEQAGSSAIARLGLAEVMLLRGKADECIGLTERVLMQLGASEPTVRASALELIVRALAAHGDTTSAAPHLEALEHTADVVGTDPLRASAAFARATLLREFGELAHAVSCYERAIQCYERSGAPFETARARADLAEVHDAMHHVDSAVREARLALASLQSLGAAREAARVKRLLDAIGDAAPGKHGAPLTPRQIEILRFIAQGMSNAEIAHRLALSEHTVKRHVANLLMKLGLSSRAAAAAYAAKEGLLQR